jgi:MoaA/NifB/PqqE/SkfB family radical SAM enzyme
MDGASAGTHDAFRGMSGSFARTLDAVRWAKQVGLPVQINTDSHLAFGHSLF